MFGTEQCFGDTVYVYLLPHHIGAQPTNCPAPSHLVQTLLLLVRAKPNQCFMNDSTRFFLSCHLSTWSSETNRRILCVTPPATLLMSCGATIARHTRPLPSLHSPLPEPWPLKFFIAFWCSDSAFYFSMGPSSQTQFTPI